MSDTPQFLLHVGYPKSGTTSLQTGIFANCPDILFAGRTKGSSGEEITPEANRFRTLVYATASHLSDRSERIAAYYAASNARLAETYGITL